MRERSQDEIQLSAIDAEGLELVLEYIYTSKLSLIDLSNIQTVLSTATHLQILQVTFLKNNFTRIREYSSILRFLLLFKSWLLWCKYGRYIIYARKVFSHSKFGKFFQQNTTYFQMFNLL